MGLGLFGSNSSCSCDSHPHPVEVKVTGCGCVPNKIGDKMSTLGWGGHSESCTCNKCYDDEQERRSKAQGNPPKPLPNPDPKNHRFNRVIEVNGRVIAFVRYPNCTNYEGTKVLVYDMDLKSFWEEYGREGKVLDPHFCPNSRLKLMARFIPTINGWELARSLCESMSSRED